MDRDERQKDVLSIDKDSQISVVVNRPDTGELVIDLPASSTTCG